VSLNFKYTNQRKDNTSTRWLDGSTTLLPDVRTVLPDFCSLLPLLDWHWLFTLFTKYVHTRAKHVVRHKLNISTTQRTSGYENVHYLDATYFLLSLTLLHVIFSSHYDFQQYADINIYTSLTPSSTDLKQLTLTTDQALASNLLCQILVSRVKSLQNLKFLQLSDFK